MKHNLASLRALLRKAPAVNVRTKLTRLVPELARPERAFAAGKFLSPLPKRLKSPIETERELNLERAKNAQTRRV